MGVASALNNLTGRLFAIVQIANELEDERPPVRC